MTRWPTTLESQVCATPRTPVAIEIAIIPPTSFSSRSRSFSGIASSRMSRSRNGDTIPSPAEMAINASTAARRPRYGRKSRATLRVTRPA